MSRVALLVPDLGGGGAERVMVRLSAGLSALGQPVDLVLAHKRGPYLSEVAEGVRVVDLRASRLATALPALVRYLRRERPAVLLSTRDDCNVVAAVAKRLTRGTRVYVRASNTLSEACGEGRMRVVPRLSRWLLPGVDGIIAPSQGVADDMARVLGVPRPRITVVPNPVAATDIRARAGEPWDHPWLTDGEGPVLLAVGRLTRQKGFDTLLSALAAVRDQVPARLIILGEGECRPRLEALRDGLGLADAVNLAGFVANPYPAMARAALFVLPSRWEGFPNALLEAMALGTPVVATDCPSGPREILEGGRYGALVPVGDSEALARAILGTLADPLPPEVTRAAVAGLTPEGVARRYLELWSIVLT